MLWDLHPFTRAESGKHRSLLWDALDDASMPTGAQRKTSKTHLIGFRHN